MLTPDDYRSAVLLKPAQAIAYLKKKDPRIVMTSAEFAELAAEARGAAFTIAGVTKLDMLQDALDAVEASLKNGDEFYAFKKELMKRMGKRGWAAFIEGNQITSARLKLIYRQNAQNAFQAGRITAQKKTIALRPWWQYNAVIDGNTTQECSQLDGKVFRADDTFWLNNYPPRHMGCRGGVTTLSDRDMQREGIVASEGKDFADVQPAPGFDSQPDAGFMPDLSKYDKQLAKSYTKAKK